MIKSKEYVSLNILMFLVENVTSIEKKNVDPNTITVSPSDNDWPMPRTYVKSFGRTVRGFKFEFLNTSRRLEVALGLQQIYLFLKNMSIKNHIF